MYSITPFPPQNTKEGWLFRPGRRKYEMEVLGRYEDLQPTKKRKVPKPAWVTSKKRQEDMDALTKELTYPSQWSVHVLFEFGGGMKTTEALLKLGPVGAYQFSFADCDQEFLKTLIDLFKLLGTVMYKTSTPAERAKVKLQGAELFTKLEMIMPSAWNTFVLHNCSYHCVDTLESCSAFWCCNMLDHERMHTLLKQMARSRKDLFASVANHYGLLEMTLIQHLDPEEGGPELALAPRRSTPSGFECRPASSLRADGELEIATVGTAKRYKLSSEEMDVLQHLWRIAEPEYEALWSAFEKHNTRCAAANRLTELSELQSTQRFEITDEHRKMMTMHSHAQVRA